jgi:hypothetical protein
VQLSLGWSNGTHLYANITRKVTPEDDMDESISLEHDIGWIVAMGDDINKKHTISRKIQMNLGTKGVCHYLCSNCIGELSSNCIKCSTDVANQINGICLVPDLERPYASEEILEDGYTIANI